MNLNAFTFLLVYSAAAYFGLVQRIDGATNVLLFMVWLVSLMVLVCAGSEDGRASLRKRRKERALTYYVYNIVDSVVVLGLVWHGYWVTAVVLAAAVIAVCANANTTSAAPAPLAQK